MLLESNREMYAIHLAEGEGWGLTGPAFNSDMPAVPLASQF